MKQLRLFGTQGMPIYGLVSSFVVERGVVQLYMNNPVFGQTETGSALIFHRYSRKKYLLYLRMSTETQIEEEQESLNVLKWGNFPMTYDQVAELLYIEDTSERGFAFENSDKQLFGQLQPNQKLKLAFVERGQSYGYIMERAQYSMLQTQIKQSLLNITGWRLPSDFAKPIDFLPRESNSQ